MVFLFSEIKKQKYAKLVKIQMQAACRKKILTVLQNKPGLAKIL
jgi:hypothetical protein